MKKILKITAVFLASTCLYISAGCTDQAKSQSVNLNISAAASLKDSLEEVKKTYEAESSNISLTINYGSSGALQQQIEQGADVDMFLSAAPKQMNALENSNLILKDSRKDLLLNDVVLVVHKDNSTISSFNDLTLDKASHIALGEPKSVPVGEYAEEVLKSLGILDVIKSKAVYGKDVKEVLNWVETGNADAGIVYATDAKVSTKVKIIATASSDSHKPVTYPIAIIKASKKIDAAKEFMNFLTSEKAKNTFEKYGFKTTIK